MTPTSIKLVLPERHQRQLFSMFPTPLDRFPLKRGTHMMLYSEPPRSMVSAYTPYINQLFMLQVCGQAYDDWCSAALVKFASEDVIPCNHGDPHIVLGCDGHTRLPWAIHMLANRPTIQVCKPFMVEAKLVIA